MSQPRGGMTARYSEVKLAENYAVVKHEVPKVIKQQHCQLGSIYVMFSVNLQSPSEDILR